MKATIWPPPDNAWLFFVEPAAYVHLPMTAPAIGYNILIYIQKSAIITFSKKAFKYTLNAFFYLSNLSKIQTKTLNSPPDLDVVFVLPIIASRCDFHLSALRTEEES